MNSRYPPGPKDWLFGINLVNRMRADLLGFYTNLAHTYGDIVYMRLGWFDDYFISHPDMIREVLLTKAKIFHKMAWQKKVLRRWNGPSLLITEGDVWLRQRRLVQPAFHPKRFAAYAEVMAECARRMLDAWDRTCDSRGNHEIEIEHEMTALSLEVACRTLFGVDVTDKTEELGKAVALLSAVAVKEMSQPITLPDWLPLPGKRRKAEAVRLLNETVWGFIRQRRASGEDKGDLLSMLLLAVDEEGGGQLTDEEVRNQVMTLFLAGHDTSASGMIWTWYVLARNPDIQARVVEEIESVLEGEGRTPTAEDVARLKYTEMVVKESLRLYPPAVAVFARESTEEVELGGYRLRKGSLVHIFSYVTHRDPRWFPEPEKVDPERFAPGRVERIPPYAYFPFGGGPRICIGNTFAMMEMMLVTAMTLQRFRMTLAPGQGEVKLVPNMSLRPAGGIRMTAVRRTATKAGSAA